MDLLYISIGLTNLVTAQIIGQNKKRTAMMNDLKQWLSGLTRLSSSRGFGIQSPWAFKMMTEVIAERGSRDEYKRLLAMYSQQTSGERRFHELIFRIEEHLKFPFFVDTTDDRVAADYARAANQELRVAEWGKTDESINLPRAIYHCHISDQELNLFINNSPFESLIIVDGIRDNTCCKHLWMQHCDAFQRGSTFDLYSHALMFIIPKKSVLHYRGPCI